MYKIDMRGRGSKNRYIGNYLEIFLKLFPPKFIRFEQKMFLHFNAGMTCTQRTYAPFFVCHLTTCLPVIRIYESIDEPIVTIMLNETVIQV